MSYDADSTFVFAFPTRVIYGAGAVSESSLECDRLASGCGNELAPRRQRDRDGKWLQREPLGDFWNRAGKWISGR